MKKLLTAALVSISCLAAAQVPGYLGKRFSIGYSVNLWPSYLHPGANSEDDGELGLNVMHSANIEYTIKNRTNFCASLQYLHTGLDHSYTLNGYTSSSSYYGPEQETFNYKPKSKLPIQQYTTGASIGFKFFKRGFFAPVGKYTKVDLTVFFNTMSYEKDAFYYDTYKTATPIGTGNSKSTSFSLGYSIGRQRVIANRLVLDFGMRFAIVPAAVLSVLADNFNESGNTQPDDELKHYANQRLFGEQLVNFHIGLSFLAF